MKKSSLKDAVIAITYQCNSCCRMCNIWKQKENFYSLNLNDFKKLPKSLRDVNISGGEPFLHKDIVEIVEVIKKRCNNPRIIISSNGFATKLIVEKMKAILKIDSNIGIAISIDGGKKTHEMVRGVKDGFEKTVNTITELKKIGVKGIRIAFTIGDYNFNDLKTVYNLSKKLNVQFTISIVHGSENFFNTENEVDEKEGIIQALEWLKRKELKTWNLKRWVRTYYVYGMQYFIKTEKRILPNYSGQKNIFIDPYGNIFPCDISTEKIGELSDIKNLKNIKSKDCENSWMICTARESIKRHWFRVGLWILINRFSGNCSLIIKKS